MATKIGEGQVNIVVGGARSFSKDIAGMRKCVDGFRTGINELA